MSEKFHDDREIAEGLHLMLQGCACHVCHVKLCSRSLGMHRTSAPSHLVHDHLLQVGKPERKSIRLLIVEQKNFLHTFMSAFESSPVHCLKFLPSEKCQSPAKGGASVMLKLIQQS